MLGRRLTRRKPIVLTGMRRAQPAGALVAAARTLDQARGVVTFLDAASERTLRSTVALTAARGRGKSAVRPPPRSQRVHAHVAASPGACHGWLPVVERQPGAQERQSSFRHCC
jgi:hypothetical protein